MSNPYPQAKSLPAYQLFSCEDLKNTGVSREGISGLWVDSVGRVMVAYTDVSL